MNENTYNGWLNRETWLVALWLGNDYADQLRVSTLASEAIEQHPDDPECAAFDLARTLEGDFGSLRFEYQVHSLPGLYRDLLDTAWARIDWPHLARTYINDALEV
jgi:hypothetical protein